MPPVLTVPVSNNRITIGESLHIFALVTRPLSQTDWIRMSKIAIISQPDEGVLIDVSGCSNLKEALEHLSSTLQVSSQFWQGLNVSINLGGLLLGSEDAAQVLAIAKGVGITPSAVYTKNGTTKVSFIEHGINIGEGKPMSLPEVNIDTENIDAAEVEETGRPTSKSKSAVAKIKLRVKDAFNRRKTDTEPQSDYKVVEQNIQEPKVELEESEKDIRETISNRIIQLAKETESEQTAESGSVPKDNSSISVAVDALEEISTTMETETEVQQETHTEAASQVESASMLEAESGAAIRDDVIESDVVSTNELTTGEDALQKNEEFTCETDDTTCETTTSEEEEEERQVSQSCEEAEETSETPEAPETSIDITFDNEPQQSKEEEEEVLATESETEEVLEEEVSDQEKTEIVRPVAGGTMYLRQTLRSGQTVSHKGHLIIIGDVNPGAEVMAEGDITIWGSLRGIAHAGIGGNVEAEIRALNLQPIQIRIAHAIARAPDKPRMKYSTTHGPEAARIVAGKIRVFRSRLE